MHWHRCPGACAHRQQSMPSAPQWPLGGRAYEAHRVPVTSQVPHTRTHPHVHNRPVGPRAHTSSFVRLSVFHMLTRLSLPPLPTRWYDGDGGGFQAESRASSARVSRGSDTDSRHVKTREGCRVRPSRSLRPSCAVTTLCASPHPDVCSTNHSVVRTKRWVGSREYGRD